MTAEPLVIEKSNKKDGKNVITYIRLTTDLRDFVDGVAKELDCTRSDAIRKIIEESKARGVQIK